MQRDRRVYLQNIMHSVGGLKFVTSTFTRATGWRWLIFVILNAIVHHSHIEIIWKEPCIRHHYTPRVITVVRTRNKLQYTILILWKFSQKTDSRFIFSSVEKGINSKISPWPLLFSIRTDETIGHIWNKIYFALYSFMIIMYTILYKSLAKEKY